MVTTVSDVIDLVRNTFKTRNFVKYGLFLFWLKHTL